MKMKNLRELDQRIAALEKNRFRDLQLLRSNYHSAHDTYDAVKQGLVWGQLAWQAFRFLRKNRKNVGRSLKAGSILLTLVALAYVFFRSRPDAAREQ